MLKENTLVDSRYQIIKELGKGGMGVVYLARDQEKQKEVALKLIRPNIGHTRRRTLREFFIMSRLEHPHIVNVYQSGTYQRQAPYIIMPFLSGGTLSKRYANGTKDRIDLINRLTRIVEVTEALHYIHQEGIIHRDLKPENIMLNFDENNKEFALLMDFGLARGQVQENALIAFQDEINKFVGSIYYASPEQITSRELDTRSDLYSLGCVLYWIIIGQSPFIGEVSTVLRGHMDKPVESLAKHIDFLPNSLDEVVLTLLQKSPADRYNDAAEVVNLLHKIIEDLRPKETKSLDKFEAISTFEPLRESDVTPVRLFVPPFIGRSKQLEVCKLALEELAVGKSNIVLLQSSFGLGLSRFLEELEHKVRGTEFVLLKFNNNQSHNLPYQPWQSVLKNLHRNKEEAFNQAASGLELALSPLIPEFGINEDYEIPAEVAQMRLFQAVEQFLSRFLRDEYLVILVDDVHLVDEGSLGLLAYLARSKFKAMFMVIAWHPNHKNHASNVYIQKCFSDLLTHNLELEPFDEIMTIKLLKAFLGGDIEKRLESYVLERVEGNPLFIEELLSLLLKEKHIKLRKGLWEWTREHTGLPERVEEVFAARLDVLKDSPKRTLSVASTIGNYFKFDLLYELLEVDEESLLDDIDELLQAELIEELTKDRYRFTHMMLREVVHERLRSDRRSHYHRRLAEKLKKQKDIKPSVLGDHYAETKTPYLAVPYALEAARNATKVFANDVAEKYFRLALECIDKDEKLKQKHKDSDKRVQIQLELGQVLKRIGRLDEAESLYRKAEGNENFYPQALSSLGSLSQIKGNFTQSEVYLREALKFLPNDAELYCNLSNVLLSKNDFQEAEKILHLGLSVAIKTKNASTIALVQSNLGYLEYSRNNWETALEWLTSAKEYTDKNSQPLLYARIIYFEGNVYTRLGKPAEALRLYEEVHVIYQRVGDLGKAINSLLQIGIVYQEKGELDKAITILKKVNQQADRLGRKNVRLNAMTTLGWTLQRQGHFEQALEILEESYLPLLNEGNKSEAILNRMNMAVIAARGGKIRDARQYSHEADSLLKNITASSYLLALLNLTKGEVELRDHCIENALTLLENAIKQLDKLHCNQELLEAYLLLSETQLALNQHEGCASSLEAAKPLITQINDPLWKLHLNYLDALNNQGKEEINKVEEQLKMYGQKYLIDLISNTIDF